MLPFQNLLGYNGAPVPPPDPTTHPTVMEVDQGSTAIPLPNGPNGPSSQPLPLPAPAPAPDGSPSSHRPQDNQPSQQLQSMALPLQHPLQGPPRQPGVGISPGSTSAADFVVAPSGPSEAAEALAVTHREAAGAAPGAEVMSPSIATGQDLTVQHDPAEEVPDEPMWAPSDWMVVRENYLNREVCLPANIMDRLNAMVIRQSDESMASLRNNMRELADVCMARTSTLAHTFVEMSTAYRQMVERIVQQTPAPDETVAQVQHLT